MNQQPGSAGGANAGGAANAAYLAQQQRLDMEYLCAGQTQIPFPTR